MTTNQTCQTCSHWNDNEKDAAFLATQTRRCLQSRLYRELIFVGNDTCDVLSYDAAIKRPLRTHATMHCPLWTPK